MLLQERPLFAEIPIGRSATQLMDVGPKPAAWVPWPRLAVFPAFSSAARQASLPVSCAAHSSWPPRQFLTPWPPWPPGWQHVWIVYDDREHLHPAMSQIVMTANDMTRSLTALVRTLLEGIEVDADSLQVKFLE